MAKKTAAPVTTRGNLEATMRHIRAVNKKLVALTRRVRALERRGV